MCVPINFDNKILNNIYMKSMSEEKRKIDLDKALAQWIDLYEILTGYGLVYLLPSKKGLQDQVFVNSFALLPHLLKENRTVVILSNFTAEGRSGEEEIAKNLLETLNYECIKSPYKFEGEPELKYLPGANIYIGTYGIRTQLETHEWIEKTFNAKIIKINVNKEINGKNYGEWFYHGDTIIFPIDKENTLVNTEVIDKKIIREIEKYTNILPVTINDSICGICNSIRCGFNVITATNIDDLTKGSQIYEMEKAKNEKIEKYANQLGLEVVFVDFDEFYKAGAMPSCCVARLNYVDYFSYEVD